MEKTQIIANYHTHSVFCDGKDIPEDIAETAYNQGCKYLGYSSHSAFPFRSDCELKYEDFESYKERILSLRKAYKGRMEIFYGFEADYLPPLSWPDREFYKDKSPDYLIGSVHYVWNEKEPMKGSCTVDDSVENVKKGLEKIFNGDSKKMIQTYFDHERQMLSTCKFDIIGHPDLVRKRNSQLKLFNENDPWYKKEIKATAKAIKNAGVIVEINTGGMARGAIDSPYPSLEFLTLLNSYDVPIIYSSDAHKKDYILYGFDRAKKLAEMAGYSQRCYLTSQGWKTTSL